MATVILDTFVFYILFTDLLSIFYLSVYFLLIIYSYIVLATYSFIWRVATQYFILCGCECDLVCISNLIYLSFVLFFQHQKQLPHSKHRGLRCVMLRLGVSPPVSSTDHIIGITWAASGSHGCRRTRPPLRCWVCFFNTLDPLHCHRDVDIFFFNMPEAAHLHLLLFVALLMGSCGHVAYTGTCYVEWIRDERPVLARWANNHSCGCLFCSENPIRCWKRWAGFGCPPGICRLHLEFDQLDSNRVWNCRQCCRGVAVWQQLCAG